MAKTKYIARDHNGTVHTRSTERTYTHTVVFKRSYLASLAFAASDHKVDASNFAHYVGIAAGDGAFHQNYMANYPDKWTPEQIAANQIVVDRQNADRQADAKARVEGHDVASYIEACRAGRIAAVEAKKAEGYYDRWYNAGWCGRFDLAQKLAAKTVSPYYPTVAILVAEAL